MKKFVILITLLFFANLAWAEQPKTKRVCKEVTVKGKKQEQCKTIKVHKKLEGTKVPTKK